MILDGKVAIVTGSGRGIGRTIALKLAGVGCNVVVNDIVQAEQELRSVGEEIKGMGKDSLAIPADISLERDVARLVKTAISNYGKIDILVNNVGVEGPIASVVDMNLEMWNYVLAVNLTGAMLCAKHALKESMIPRQTGAIINLSSSMGRDGIGSALRSSYCTSKAGIIGLTKSLAWEVGKYGIRVNCVAPGLVEGDRIERVNRAKSRASNMTFEEITESCKARSPLHRMAKPEEVAALIVLLASDQSSGITGQTINCCTGITMT